MKRIFTIVVAALFALSTYLVVAPASAGDSSSFSPIMTPDGERYDVDMFQFDYNSQLAVMNNSNGVIRVHYSDPTYGSQTRTIKPGLDNGGSPMCADLAYQDSNPVTVTFNVGTKKAITGTGEYNSMDSQVPEIARHSLLRAKVVLKKATKALKKAKQHHAKRAKLKRLTKRVRHARAEVRTARSAVLKVRKDAAYCKARRVD